MSQSNDDAPESIEDHPHVKRAVLWATAWFFCILFGYMVVRPIRETMGTTVGSDGLRNLMWITLVVMIIAVPSYAWLVKRMPRRWLVRTVFHIFTACLVAFYFAMQSDWEPARVMTSYGFFVWVNVFSLYTTSVFWSVLADLFSHQQGKRLFGLIAAGGTSGAISGSFLTSRIASLIGTHQLILITIASIQAGLWCAWRLERQMAIDRRSSDEELESDSIGNRELSDDQPTTEPANSESDKPNVDASLWSGVIEVARSPYLAAICLFLFFFQTFGTQLYFQQADIVSATLTTKEAKTEFFANLDLGAQVLTLVLQTLISGFVLRRLGVSVALVALPLASLVVFTSLSLHPSLWVLGISMIVVRGMSYGLTVPAREVLFTVVSKNQKYKSKNFIDTVLMRGADAISSAGFTQLKNLQIPTAQVNLFALPLVALWAIVAWRLGQLQKKKSQTL
ncbi:MFS transporter [Rubripirellula amarantea]|nr:MFS transporter [Rubripirellula amarantea]